MQMNDNRQDVFRCRQLDAQHICRYNLYGGMRIMRGTYENI